VIPTIEETKLRVQQQLSQLHSGTKRFVNPHTYPVGLEKKLFDTKTSLILKLRGGK
jgi:nicotinate phosphoribosyltransferase